MTSKHDPQRHVEKLVRAYLDQQARSVDAHALVDRIKQTTQSGAQSHAVPPVRVPRLWAGAAMAAGVLVGLVAAFHQPLPTQPPDLPALSAMVQQPGRSALAGAFTGVSAAGSFLEDAAAVSASLPASLPKPLPTTNPALIEDMKSDASVLAQSLRHIFDSALSEAGLKS